MIAEIANLRVFASKFPTLSAFAASASSLFHGQFFLFVPEDGFFFFDHRVVELVNVSSRTAPCATWVYVCVFVYELELTARIPIDAFDLSFFFIFLDRGKISRFFFVLALE